MKKVNLIAIAATIGLILLYGCTQSNKAVSDHFKWIVEPTFDSLYPFTEGLAGASVNDQWGFIDTAGVWVIQPQFGCVRSFLNGIAAVSFDKSFSTGAFPTFGFINKKGVWVIQPQFKQIDLAVNRRNAWIMRVKYNEKEGYISHTGVFSEEIPRLNQRAIYVSAYPVPNVIRLDNKLETIFDGDFEWAFTDFSNGLLKAHNKKTQGWGYIDSTAHWTILPLFKDANDFSEGLAAVQDKSPVSNWGYIDTKGQWAIEPVFDKAGNFSEELACVSDSKSGKYGYIDPSGNWVITPSFFGANPFSEGLAAAKKYESSKWGYIDKTGEWVIQPQFEEIQNFSKGMTMVKLNGKWGLIRQQNSETMIRK